MHFLTCPICGKSFDSARSAAMPFCSHRCQQIDLGRWLHEDYGVPWEPDDPSESEEPPPDAVDGSDHGA